MKIMDRIAIFFVILLVSASAVPAFAGSLGDAPDAPSIEGALGAEAGAGAADNDSRLPDEPLLEPVSPGEDSGGLGEDTPAPTAMRLLRLLRRLRTPPPKRPARAG